jgi:ribulose-phosphate 3-epimerase
MVQIYPSLIAADMLNLEKEIQKLDPYVNGYHLDIMDYHFVRNLTFGPDTVNAVRRITDKPLYVHLMVDYPERYFERMKLHPHDIVAIHPESLSKKSFDALTRSIISYNWHPSLALNPETPTSIIQTLTTPLSHLLLMSVSPGFSGQKFMPRVFEKMREVLLLEKTFNNPFIIAIDGGINQDNAKALVQEGANQLIIGSALFSKNDPLEALFTLQSSLKSSQK